VLTGVRQAEQQQAQEAITHGIQSNPIDDSLCTSSRRVPSRPSSAPACLQQIPGIWTLRLQREIDHWPGAAGATFERWAKGPEQRIQHRTSPSTPAAAQPVAGTERR
jgi:hypothetical protein